MAFDLVNPPFLRWIFFVLFINHFRKKGGTPVKLVYKNTIVISMLITISMISISAFGYLKAKDFLYERFEEQAYGELESIKANIDIWIDGKQETMKYIAEADVLKGNDTEKADALGSRLAEKMGNPDAFAFMDANGFLYLGGAKIPVSEFEHFQGGMKELTKTYNPVPSSSPSVNGAPIVLTSSPIYGANGEVVGVASGGNQIESLVNIVTQNTIGDSGYVTVFTGDGTIVAGKEKEDTLNKTIASYENKDLNAMVEESMAGKSGVIETSIEGVDSLVFYSKANEMDWGIMISISTQEAFADARSLLNYFIIMTIVFILLGALISYIINHSSLKPIQQVNEKIEELVTNNGDLTQRLSINRKDEVGKLANNFNSLLDSLQDLIRDILHKGEVVSDSTTALLDRAEEMVQLSDDVTKNVQHSAEISIEQETGNKNNLQSIHVITQSVSEIKDHSSLVSDKTKNAYKDVEKANEEIKALMNQMGDIQKSVRSSSETIKKLGNRSSEIGNIVGMITSITEQTNLLALNASIEAARDGEHGKGFAVVANEVKKLAGQSAQSAAQISELVNQILSETSSAVVEIESGTNQFGTGMDRLKGVNGILQNVYQSSKSSSNEVDLIFDEIETLLSKLK